MKPLRFFFKIGVPKRSELKNWGDYYLAKSFGEELRRRGHYYQIQILPEWHTDKDFEADVVIHFRGLSKYKTKPYHFNIMWNISHPEQISIDEYNQYDLVLVSSFSYAEELSKKVKVPVYPLLQFVDINVFYPDTKEEYRNDILFVGNSRKVLRPIVRDIIPPPKPLAVYGDKWENLISKEYIKGRWFPNEKLRQLYSSCTILLNDHWEDMRQFGFINNRFFDAIACKAIVINDDHPEIKRLFPKALTYKERKDLLSLIEKIYENTIYFKEITSELYEEIISKHTVSCRVNEFLKILENHYIEKEIPKQRHNKSLKQLVSDFLLDTLGYGKVYRAIHKIYMNAKNINLLIKKVLKQCNVVLNKITGKEGLYTLINMTTETEVKCLANRLAKPYRKENEPLISIIIPTKNGLKHLKRLIPYLLNNTLYQNYEVLIVDNKSKDNTRKYIESIKDNRIKWVPTNGDLNFSQSVNFGARISKGEILVLLNNDTLPLYGWLDELLTSYYSLNDCGVVGSRLIYNELNTSRKNGEVIYPGCSVQHDGIKFNWTKYGIQPYNSGKYKNPMHIENEIMIEEVPAVSAACLLVHKKTFEKVGGFDESYQFGKEDVDFSLKVKALGKRNFINRKSLLIHREFSTQIRQSKKTRKQWRKHNNKIFNDKWGEYLYTEIWKEKIHNLSPYWNENRMHICFMVTENVPNTTAGDLFSAQGLGEALTKLYGYKVSYLPRRPVFEWGHIPESVDLAIFMRHDYDIRRSKVSNKTLKIAWIRGYISEWLNKPWIHDFDGIITTSHIAMKEVLKVVPHEKCWGVIPLGITSEFINQVTESVRDIDVCFVGNIFEVPRDIVKNLDVNRDFNFHFYGQLHGGKNHPWKKFHKGTIRHSELPSLYRRSKIVIEDTAPFNKGTVNLRIFEAAACGALVIANETPGLEELFNTTIPIYKNKQDLTAMIEYYLNNEEERFKLASKIREEVLKNHTFMNRAQEFFNMINKIILEEKRLLGKLN